MLHKKNLLKEIAVFDPSNNLSFETPLSANRNFQNQGENDKRSFDENILIGSSIKEISKFSDNAFKGAYWQDAVPDDVVEAIAAISSQKKAEIRGVFLNASSTTGSIDFPRPYIETFPSYVLDYIEEVSKQFKQVGDWETQFLFQSHLGKFQKASSFHPDSKGAFGERHFRLLAHISRDIEDRDHETELLDTDGMLQTEIVSTFYNEAPYDELNEDLKNRVHLAHTGDLIGVKGLGDGHGNILKDAWVHRTPIHKKNFESLGKQRDSLIWQRVIHEELDLD